MAAEPEAWGSVPLENLAEETSPITYGVVKPGNEGEVPFVRGGDIAGGRVLIEQLRTITSEVSQQYRRTLLRGGELLVSLVGNPGQVAIAPASLAGANIARQVGLVRLRREVDSGFVSYFLQSPKGQEALGAQSLGSVQQVINLKDLKTVKVPLPPLPEQRAIARILGTLDNKIELNRRMNATLEAMARALFQSWFVDFDPVHAKAAGRPPSGMSLATAALFPASFQDSPLGAIPSGWKVGSILKQARLLSGGTPKTNISAYWDGEIPWASAKDVSQCGESFLIETERQITERGLEESTTKMIPAFATVIVARGATTGRLTMFGTSMAMNQTCYGLHSTIDAPLALHCQARSFIEQMVHAAHGSVFDTITTKTFETTDVLLPQSDALRVFNKTVSPIFAQIRTNLHQSRTLAALRDTLLPRLLNGELSVERLKKLTRS